jgi:hypothetical protein
MPNGFNAYGAFFLCITYFLPFGKNKKNLQKTMSFKTIIWDKNKKIIIDIMYKKPEWA